MEVCQHRCSRLVALSSSALWCLCLILSDGSREPRNKGACHSSETGSVPVTSHWKIVGKRYECLTFCLFVLKEIQAKLAAQKLAERLNIKMQSYNPEGESSRKYREVRDEDDDQSSEDEFWRWMFRLSPKSLPVEISLSYIRVPNKCQDQCQTLLRERIL